MKFPMYSDGTVNTDEIDNLIWSLVHDYDSVDERVAYQFHEIEHIKEGSVMYTIKPTEEAIGIVFHQIEVATGKKFKFTITREAA